MSCCTRRPQSGGLQHLLLGNQWRSVLPTWARGEELPPWAYDKAVRRIIQEEGEVPTLDRVAGPAVFYGFCALLGLTYFLTVLPVVGYYIAKCPEDGDGFAIYPEAVLWVLFFAPLAVIVTICQWKCMTYVSVPLLAKIQNHGTEATGGNSFDFLGVPATTSRFLSFRLWFYAMTVISLLSLLDNMTNALFTAKTLATKNCASYGVIQEVWARTMASSFFAPLLAYTSLDFADICLIFYLLQLFVQPAFALAMTYPISKSPSYEIDPEGVKTEEAYKTLSDSRNKWDKTTYGSAVMILAEANRMELITSQDMKYRVCSTSSVLDMSLDVGNDMGYEAAYLEMKLAAIGRGNARFTMKGLLQNALQVNMQVSLIAISKTVLKGGIDTMNAYTVFLTVLGMLGDVPDMVAIIRYARERPPEVIQRLAAYLDARDDGADDDQRKALLDANRRRFKLLEARTRRLFLYMFLYVGMALYAGVKLIMALLVCQDGVWNMTVWKGHYGCVAWDT